MNIFLHLSVSMSIWPWSCYHDAKNHLPSNQIVSFCTCRGRWSWRKTIQGKKNKNRALVRMRKIVSLPSKVLTCVHFKSTWWHVPVYIYIYVWLIVIDWDAIRSCLNITKLIYEKRLAISGHGDRWCDHVIHAKWCIWIKTSDRRRTKFVCAVCWVILLFLRKGKLAISHIKWKALLKCHKHPF